MQTVATITSKRQLTIPARIFKSAGLKEQQKVIIREEGKVIKIEPAFLAVERLAGSVRVPARFRGMDADKIISKSKEEYFATKRR